MTIRKQLEQDQANWIEEARRIIHGQRKVHDRPTCEALLIGLRHYRKLKLVQSAIKLLAGHQFKGEPAGGQGDQLVKRLVEDWKKPLIG